MSMKIENSLIRKKLSIKYVPMGDCFIYDDRLCIKVSDSHEEPNFPNTVIDLNHNRVCRLDDLILVTPVSAKIVIGEE